MADITNKRNIPIKLGDFSVIDTECMQKQYLCIEYTVIYLR